MSAGYYRKFAREKHARLPWKRQHLNATQSAAADFPTTTTITVVKDLSTSIQPYSTIIQSHGLASTQLETTTTVSITDTNTLPSQTPTSSVSLASSASASSFTSSPPTSSGLPLSHGNKTSPSSLHPGAIAGVVIVCIFVFLTGIFFAVRMWFKKKRASKLRKTWPRSSAVGIRRGTDVLKSSSEPKTALGDAVQIPSPHVSVPSTSYNNSAVFQSPVSSSSPSAPVYSPGLALLSPYSTTVVCTFIPSLPDELTILVGETLRVLAEYEDGWSLCIDCRGEQGMVPNECLDRSSVSMELLPPSSYRVARSSTRVTSLAQVIAPGH